MSSFFYLHTEKNTANSSLIDDLIQYAEIHNQQIYVINRPLVDNKYRYEFQEALVILAPNHKIVFVNLATDTQGFDEFTEDFIEDLGSISDKFRYRKILGRPREWRSSLICTYREGIKPEEVGDTLARNQLSSGQEKKKVELLISLLTGSINDIDRVKGDVPDNILDRVKQKILLFDGDQTRFIYQRQESDIVRIQGLSGTGKTELLLHKLKDIYLEAPETKVMFTCHNKVLADSLRKRIPEFFDFMKVEEQIKWNEKLWCVNAWGSRYKPHSGAYSYICAFYGLAFHSYSYSSTFKQVCQKAIEDLTEDLISERGYAFDYMLIDESQDFSEEFFQLCKLVTKNTVFVAGDIFQGIFDTEIISEIEPDFLLSKCYRTDPRTLMFAHALGMGLFETPKLRWLENEEWKACGYIVNQSSEKELILTREPLRRFEDLGNDGFSSMDIFKESSDSGEVSETKILEIIHQLKLENPTILADDIGVIFLDGGRSAYTTADKLEMSIPRLFGWSVNKAYESKQRIPDTLFVSNTNNVKGLEFAFVICVTKKIARTPSYRNALYMMLTRSFIKTFLLTSEEANKDLIGTLDQGLRDIKQHNRLRIAIPSEQEKTAIRTTIKATKEVASLYDLSQAVFDELGVEPLFQPNLRSAVKSIVGDEYDYEKVFDIIRFNYEQMRGQN